MVGVVEGCKILNFVLCVFKVLLRLVVHDSSKHRTTVSGSQMRENEWYTQNIQDLRIG